MRHPKQNQYTNSTNSDSYFISDDESDEDVFKPAKRKHSKKSKPKRVARFISSPPLPISPVPAPKMTTVPIADLKITKVASRSVEPVVQIKDPTVIQPQPKQIKIIAPPPKLIPDYHVPSCFDIIPRGNCPGINIVTNELYYYVK